MTTMNYDRGPATPPGETTPTLTSDGRWAWTQRSSIQWPPPAAAWLPPGAEAWPPPTVGAIEEEPSRWRRIVSGGLALAIIAVSLLLDLEAIFVIPILFVLVVPFEKLFPRHSQPLRRPGVGTDIGYALAARH